MVLGFFWSYVGLQLFELSILLFGFEGGVDLRLRGVFALVDHLHCVVLMRLRRGDILGVLFFLVSFLL